jgi:hypothetical protein
MTHGEKVAHLLSELKAKNVAQFTIAPPMFRLLWALGIEIPPPFFIHFFPLMFLGAVVGGSVTAVSMWLTMRHGAALVPCTVLGVLSGLITAACYRWKAASLKLPDWKNYGISN